MINLKKRGKKVSLALGGWNDSAGDKYSRLVNNPAARRRFIKHALDFLDRYGFDGLDLDWEYPKCWQVRCSTVRTTHTHSSFWSIQNHCGKKLVNLRQSTGKFVSDLQS